MARVIIRIPGQCSRWLLKLIGTLVTFVFAIFTYATGQAPQQAIGKSSAAYSTGTLFKADTLLDSVKPLYGVVMMYGVVQPGTIDLTVKGILRSETGNLPIGNISVVLENDNKVTIDSGSSAQDGSFSFALQALPGTYTWILKTLDIGGTYKEKDTLITIDASADSTPPQIELSLDRLASGVTLDNRGAPGAAPSMSARYLKTGFVDIRYEVPPGISARLSLYDALGAFMREINGVEHTPGEHALSADCSGLGTGVYFLKLHGGDFTAVTRFSVTR